MAQFSLNEIWSLFEWLDIGSVYDLYQPGIDLFIAFLFFLAASKIALAKRFPGRGGSVLIVAVSLALSVGFGVAEREMRFSLRSFGPIAVFVIIFTVSVVLLNLLHGLGMQRTSALCLAYIVVYLSLATVAPTVFDWVSEVASWINGVLLLAFVISCVKLVYTLFWKRTSLSSIASKIDTYSGKSDEIKKEEQEENSDIKDAKSERRLTKKGKGNTKDIGSNLRSILKAIDKSGNTREGRSKIGTALQRISKSEHSLFLRLGNLERLNNKLGRHDSQRYQALRDRYATASGSEKETLRVEIIYEQQKLKAEQGIAALKDRIIQQTNAMNENIRLAVNIIRDGPDIRQAKPYVDRAVECEEAIAKELGNIIGLEKAVAELSRREKKTIRKDR